MTVEELDALEHYKIIGDESEVKWFYDHCVHPLKRNEAYAFCLASRHKKLTEEERKGTGLGRSEMLDPTVVFADAEGNTTYARWKKGIRAYECHKETFTTKEGQPFPAKTLVCYFHINPCDELSVVKDLKKYIAIHEQELIDSAMRDIERANEIANISTDLRSFCDATPSLTAIDHMEKRIKALDCKTNESGTSQSLYKMCKSLSKMKRLQFDNVGTKYWVDFDMDIKKEFRGTTQEEKLLTLWRNYCTEKFSKGKFIMIKTGGGLHTLVDKDCIRFDPNLFISEFLHFVNTDFELETKSLTDIASPMDNPFKKVPDERKYKLSALAEAEVKRSEGKAIWKNVRSYETDDGDKFYFTPNYFIDELVYNTNAMAPVPGTYQYGNIVKVLNKDDFGE